MGVDEEDSRSTVVFEQMCHFGVVEACLEFVLGAQQRGLHVSSAQVLDVGFEFFDVARQPLQVLSLGSRSAANDENDRREASKDVHWVSHLRVHSSEDSDSAGSSPSVSSRSAGLPTSRYDTVHSSSGSFSFE